MTERQPSIGIEIELPWKVMLARVDPDAAEILKTRKSYWATDGEERDTLQAALDKLDAKYKPLIRAAHTAGIGRGLDGYAEFAHRPRTSVEPLLDEVDYLYRGDILTPNEIYPLHITLGGFTLNSAAGQLLFGLEVVGHTCPERVLQTKSWNRKGKAGLLARKPIELALGYEEGVEFRTLELYSQDQLRTLLVTALAGARAIMHEGWSNWREVLREAAAKKDIIISQPWPHIDDDEEHWLKYAAALNDREWVDETEMSIQDLLD